MWEDNIVMLDPTQGIECIFNTASRTTGENIFEKISTNFGSRDSSAKFKKMKKLQKQTGPNFQF